MFLNYGVHRSDKEENMKVLSGVICLALLGFAMMLYASSSSAAMLLLKNGQRVEGAFVGGSDKEVRMQVGSQTLKFAVDEIAQIVFDPAAVAQGYQSTPFEQAAKEVLRELKALQSVVTGGVTYQDYGRRFSDAKIKVDAFIDEYRESPVPAFNEHVSDAIGYYNAASTAWSRKITVGETESLANNPYCLKCVALQKAIDDFAAIDKRKRNRMNDGIHIAISGMSPLWECASDAIAQAEKAIGKR